MRSSIGILAFIGFGAVSAALADPSAPATATTATAAPATAPAQPAAATPASSATPATPPSPATPAASATPASAPAAAADESEEAGAANERRLLTAGYKPQTVNGVKIWCRTENSIGSRLAQQKNCGTAEDLARSVRETQDRFEATQHRQWSPTNH